MPQALIPFLPVAPLAAACVWALFVLVVEMFSSGRRFTGVAWLSAIGLVGMAAVTLLPEVRGVYGGSIAVDNYTIYFTLLTCALATGAVLLSVDYLPDAGITKGEYYPLMLFAVVGVVVMASATDLMVMFIGLETMSMAVYVLAGILRNDLRSNEAALKYFLLGAFASALLLYGIALIFAMTGSTVLAHIFAAISAPDPAAGDHLLLMLGAGLVVVGFGFKIAAVPFHLWAPDVYEGAPTSVTAFMATVVKVGGFAAILRTVTVALSPLHADLQTMLWIGAAVTMTAGNFAALRQTSLKRMLAYSSIAHTGYLLIGVTVGTAEGGSAVLFYLAGYGVTNLAALGVVTAISRSGRRGDAIADYAGLSQTHPVLAAAMTVCMLSLVGMPPLVGFIGKLYLFQVALQAGFVWLVLIAVVNSVVSAAYYLGVVRTMYFEEPAEDALPSARPYAAFVVAVATVATIVIGLVPGPVLGAASRAFEKILLG
jgi:NADH-quinone oxidoreductase subunit N